MPNVQTWKYVDDTTVAEIVQRDASGDSQVAVSLVEDWSIDQNMQLNGDKCKSHGYRLEAEKARVQPSQDGRKRTKNCR